MGSPLKATIAAADVTTFDIPNPGCTNGVARPFAVTFRAGKVYVGMVCTAESAGGTQANLQANVYVFDPATNTFGGTAVASFSLNYSKGKVHTSENAGQVEPLGGHIR